MKKNSEAHSFHIEVLTNKRGISAKWVACLLGHSRVSYSEQRVAKNEGNFSDRFKPQQNKIKNNYTFAQFRNIFVIV